MYTQNKTYGIEHHKLRVLSILGIPYGDTLPTITGDNQPGDPFYLTGAGEGLYLMNGAVTDWQFITGGTSAFTGSRINFGESTWTGSGLVFDVTPTSYVIMGVPYGNVNPQQITHNPADATFPRIDVHYLDNTNVAGILEGVPSATPIKPQVDTTTQIELTFVTIPAGSLVPGDITNVLVWDENTESTGTSNVAGANFNYGVGSFNGVKNTLIGAFTNLQYLKYQMPAPVDAADFTYLKFYLKLGATFTSTTFFTLFFYNGGVATTAGLNIANGQFGFNRTTVGTWQVITIPLNALTYLTNTFDTVYLRMNGANATGFAIDYMNLQAGNPVTGGGTGVNSFGGRTGVVVPVPSDYPPAFIGAEAALGNPSTNNYILSSTTAGVRSWVAQTVATNYFKGLYASLGALQAAHPTGTAGDWAQVDGGAGNPLIIHSYDLDDGWVPAGSGGAITWGGISGTLSAQTDLQTALDAKVDENAPITGATKTKVTYDAKGLVTSGADATTADIADSANKRYVTDADIVTLGSTSGVNTGDEILDYANLAAFPVTGAFGPLYYDIATNKHHKWNGTTYPEVGAGGGGGGAWGTITGTLTDQTDLATELGLKATDILASYTAGAGAVGNGDTLKQAIQKLDGNIAAQNVTIGTLSTGNNLFNYLNFR